jgi:uncharacterized membrane protein
MSDREILLRREIWFGRVLALIPWLLALLLGAVAVHLILILTLPALAPGSAYRQFARSLPLGEKLVLARAEPSTSRPSFADPFAAIALCRFDLKQGPLRLRASADGDRPLSVSVRLADGTVIYSAADRQTPGGRFNIVIVTQAQADAQDAARERTEQDDSEEANKPSAPPEDELRLISPGKTGFAVFRVLALRESDYETAVARIDAVSCSMEKAQ